MPRRERSPAPSHSPGYAESKTRGWLAFSILVNDFAAPAAEIQAWIDKIALSLSKGEGYADLRIPV